MSGPTVLVCEYPTLNGGERSLLAVADGVRGAGYELQAAAPAAGPLAAALARQRICVLPLDLHDSQGRRHPLDLCRQRIDAVIRAARPDLLHANSLSMSRLIGILRVSLNGDTR